MASPFFGAGTHVRIYCCLPKERCTNSSIDCSHKTATYLPVVPPFPLRKFPIAVYTRSSNPFRKARCFAQQLLKGGVCCKRVGQTKGLLSRAVDHDLCAIAFPKSRYRTWFKGRFFDFIAVSQLQVTFARFLTIRNFWSPSRRTGPGTIRGSYTNRICRVPLITPKHLWMCLCFSIG